MNNMDNSITGSNVFYYQGSVFVIVYNYSEVGIFYSIGEIEELEFMGKFKSLLRGEALSKKVTEFIDKEIQLKMIKDEKSTN